MFMITTSKYFDIFQGKKQYFEKEYLREKNKQIRMEQRIIVLYSVRIRKYSF